LTVAKRGLDPVASPPRTGKTRGRAAYLKVAMSLESKDVIEVRPEDRIALRRSVRLDARLRLEDETDTTKGVVTDLSVHGLWVGVARPFELGEMVIVTFEPPHSTAELSLKASVARSDRHEGAGAEMGMGLSFVGLSFEDQCVLEDALKGLPPRHSDASAPVIAEVEHDPLEDEVEQILEDEDLRHVEESGLFAIVVHGGADADAEFESLEDDELELFDVG